MPSKDRNTLRADAPERAQTRDFLEAYEQAVRDRVRDLRLDDAAIRRVVRDATGVRAQRHLNGPETAFLNLCAVPALHELLVSRAGLSGDQACAAILTENHPNMGAFATGPVARSITHPFSKALGSSPQAIYDAWAGKVPAGGTKPGSALVQSCPDFGLCRPHRVVFEGKYFTGGSPAKAQRTLATDIYQAFFYLGLPKVPAVDRAPEWNYEYACLLACDASPDQALVTAWTALPKKVRDGFWHGANLYVMIVPAHR